MGEDHLGRSQEEEEVIGNPIIEEKGKKFEAPKFSFFSEHAVEENGRNGFFIGLTPFFLNR